MKFVIFFTFIIYVSSDIETLQDLVNKMREADVDKAQPGDILLNWGTTVDKTNQSANQAGLFKYVNESLFDRPIYSKLINMQSLFIPDTCLDDPITYTKDVSISDFLDVLNGTQVFQLAYKFLLARNLTTDITTFRQSLLEIWFGTYSRCSQWTLGSSGFEHVFLGEKQIKNNTQIVSGQHNWVTYYLLQKSGDINYRGYMEHAGNLLGTWQYTWDGYNKSTGGFFIGTSPAFDFSIYTTCYYLKEKLNYTSCKFTLDNEYNIEVVTYPIKCGGDICLGTAYAGEIISKSGWPKHDNSLVLWIIGILLLGSYFY